jgi:probable rRNA maturation factor
MSRDKRPPGTRVRARRPAARRPLSRQPTVEIVVASARWRRRRGIATVLRRAIAAAAAASGRAGEIAVLLADDSAVQALNRRWRHKDAATNVLSFPARSPRGAPGPLGDIAIAYETTAREAQAARKPFAHHLAHLAVHAFLHLVGHDHRRDADAERMEALEVAILAGLAVPNPYRTGAGAPTVERG